MFEATAIVIPICVCVILPIVIVGIVFNTINNRTNRQTDIILEALKVNPNVDSEKLIESFQKGEKSTWENLSRKLLRGTIFTLMGIAFALVAIFSADDNISFIFWILCGCLGSVGIGFLITYWFSYVNIDRFLAEKEEKEHS